MLISGFCGDGVPVGLLAEVAQPIAKSERQSVSVSSTSARGRRVDRIETRRMRTILQGNAGEECAGSSHNAR